MADATYAPKVYRKQGGDSFVVASGGEIDVESGGSLKLDGTAITANAFDADFTIGTEAVNAINVAVQLNDAGGTALAVRGSVFAYLSDDANGDSIAGTAPDGGWSIGTDGLLIPVVANKAAQLVSEADGDIDITITESGADTWYLVIVLPSGKLIVSGAITFAS